jgi:hypothetical protein
MTKRALSHSPLAGTAIAAVLALCATPVAAQEAPVPDPVMTTTAVPAPLPSVEAAPAPVLTSEPIVQAVPEPAAAVAAEVPAPVAAVPSARQQIARPAARMQPAAVTPAPAVPNSADVPVAAPAAMPIEAAADVAIAPLPLAAEPAPQAAADAPISDTAAIGLGLLGLVAVGGAGVLALRRRRPADAVPVDHVASRASFAAPERKVPLTAPVMAAGGMNATRLADPVVNYDDAKTVSQSPFAAASSAAIPSGPLPTGQAAVALFDRLVRAAPDAANPFTSPKRRAKRARWLLKQHEYSLRRDTNEPFDFRSFRPSADRRITQGFTPAVQPA